MDEKLKDILILLDDVCSDKRTSDNVGDLLLTISVISVVLGVYFKTR